MPTASDSSKSPHASSPQALEFNRLGMDLVDHIVVDPLFDSAAPHSYLDFRYAFLTIPDFVLPDMRFRRQETLETKREQTRTDGAQNSSWIEQNCPGIVRVPMGSNRNPIVYGKYFSSPQRIQRFN
ncbi:hypothetical protein THAOC_20559 [Thalassiosira oceanica]|uniref:Uncharacterized protein n=1 Tax=Thalassiosira oceanica TaxID=159749 RepID=K0S220_THAOC|nr:hypothetical protein THAOC_20559 [Thalassiosira oceanica]|eukprot:EJK59245.1 hypothetical protein THAOC_20559 [Thalassiosira oceanica]